MLGMLWHYFAPQMFTPYIRPDMPLWINDEPYCTYRHCYYSGSRQLHLESDTDFLNESIHTRWAFVIVQAAEWSRHPRFHYVRYKISSLIRTMCFAYYLIYNIVGLWDEIILHRFTKTSNFRGCVYFKCRDMFLSKNTSANTYSQRWCWLM